MAHYYQDKYRSESARMAGWDYTTPSHYFVTLCTRDHVNCLGRIWDGRAYVSPLGLILVEEWLRTPYVRPYVQLDEWRVMPNHFHGILVIAARRLETEDEPPEPDGARLQADSLGSIIGQIKSVCTKRIRSLGEADFAWQPRFHDHIIRDQNELDRIRAYIIGNPGKWSEDRYYRGDA